jgi:SulP family sulfate permease
MLAWAKHYRKDYLSGDISAGVIVGLMLVPQAMAYAMLAGMPPVTGLYACIAPILIYALFGSSNYMAIGPVAVVSLMVANISGELAVPGSAEYQSIAVLLAMLSGVAMIVFAVLRFGVQQRAAICRQD